jgi:hypothetical protein
VNAFLHRFRPHLIAVGGCWAFLHQVLAPPVTVSYRRPDDLREVMRDWPPAGIDELAAVVPWRAFRWYRGQTHYYSGTSWSSTVGGHVMYESRLELARMLFADFDADVRHIVAHNLLLRVRTLIGPDAREGLDRFAAGRENEE